MKRSLARLGGVAAMGLSVVAVAGDVSARDMDGWRIEGSGTGIVEGQKYSLYNLDQTAYLGFKDRTGANLGWDGTANNGFVVNRKGNGTGPIKCGEVFAFFVEKEWIIYEKQRFGINLSSRTKLANDAWYQWKFTSCKDGEVINLNQPVTLTNTVENDSLVGCKRATGVNLCWADDVATVRGKNYRKADIPR